MAEETIGEGQALLYGTPRPWRREGYVVAARTPWTFQGRNIKLYALELLLCYLSLVFFFCLWRVLTFAWMTILGLPSRDCCLFRVVLSIPRWQIFHSSLAQFKRKKLVVWVLLCSVVVILIVFHVGFIWSFLKDNIIWQTRLCWILKDIDHLNSKRLHQCHAISFDNMHFFGNRNRSVNVSFIWLKWQYVVFDFNFWIFSYSVD